MKNFAVTILILFSMVLFLTAGITYAQSSAEESYYKGVDYAVQGEFQKAKEEFEKALKLDPFYSSAELSLKTINDIIEQKIEREIVIHIFKGVSYNNKGEYDKAIKEFTKALEINPKDATIYNVRGVAYYDKGQYDQAISDYNKAIEINPKYTDAYINRGITYFVKLENKAKGCADFKKACELGECNKYNIVKKQGDCP